MTDRRTVEIVVGGLAITLILATLGVIVLAGLTRAVPNSLENIAIAAGAALAGILSRTSTGSQAQDVTVVNEDPIPVEASDGA